MKYVLDFYPPKTHTLFTLCVLNGSYARSNDLCRSLAPSDQMHRKIYAQYLQVSSCFIHSVVVALKYKDVICWFFFN